MSNNTYKDPVFFLEPDKESGQSHRLIAMAVFDPASQMFKTSGGQTLQEMQLKYPGLKVGDFDAVIESKEAFYRGQGVVEIDAATFKHALGSLPPLGWARKKQFEAFKVSEFVAGNIVWIYCRWKDRYFRFYDSHFIRSGDIMRRLANHIRAVDSAKHSESETDICASTKEVANVE